MPYFKTSYDTTVGKIFNLSKLEFSLKEALVSGLLPSRNLGVEQIDQKKAVFVLGGQTEEMNVPLFIHQSVPLSRKGEGVFCKDQISLGREGIWIHKIPPFIPS